MLKRISMLQGIGAYSSCTASPVEFRSTALIFGYNSYGKSTLCELLRSLETGDLTEVRARQSIPGPAEQKAVLKFGEPENSEISLCLQDGSWQARLPYNIAFQVFDTGFVSRNLYSWLGPDRSNREALSKFVLGAQGVQKANEIVELRRKVTLVRSSLRALHKQLESVGDVEAFVAMQVSDSAEILRRRLEPAILELAQLKAQSSSLAEIQKRPLLEMLTKPDGEPNVFAQLNDVLTSSLESVHSRARNRVVEHLRLHMAGDRGANEWLRQGLSYLKTDKCPFCEQDIHSAPGDLIESYRQVFDDEFRRQVTRVLEQIQSFERASSTWGFFSHASVVERNIGVATSYKELDSVQEYTDLQRELSSRGARVKSCQGIRSAVLSRIKTLAEIALSQKRLAPHDAVEAIQLKDYEASYRELDSAVSSFNEIVESVNKYLDAFKTSSNKSGLEARMLQLSAAIRHSEREIRRVDSAVTCSNYLENKRQEEELNIEIKKSQESLNNEQSEYLSKFFDRINFYFEKFGSNSFSIGKEAHLDNAGYQPVITLTIKFNGTTIEPSRIGAVFSESDRRALALAIFWAKISFLSDIERRNTIVVLDDPVTSFDDNRISMAIIQMRVEATTLRQLIVLTHYHAFAKRWLEVERVGGSLSFSRLIRNASTTSIAMADEGEFLNSEQHKLFEKITDYIGNRTQESISTDLRIFLENEIRDRYRQQIAQLSLSYASLKDVIDGLKEGGVIDQAIHKEANFFREDLNGPHHLLAARSREDWAHVASMMLKFIYDKL